MSSKGVSLVEGEIVVLELDGTLVYIESIQPTFAAVVALPEQPPTRTDERVFTPGRVGAKKISPYSKASAVVPCDQLSERNNVFVATYERWREEHGNNYIDRTPAEIAAAATPTKTPAELRADKKAEKVAAKAARQTPRYARRCATCNEQPAHPNHGLGEGEHEFVDPQPIAPSSTPLTKDPKAPRPAKTSKGVPVGPFIAAANLTAGLKLLSAANPKYKDGNSGHVIATFVLESGDAGATVDEITGEIAQHPRWGTMPRDRVEVALKQLLDAGLIEGVVI